MTSFHTQLFALSKAMFTLEFRVRETLALLCTLALLIAVIISFGIGSAFLDPQGRERIFPAMVWLSFMLNAAVTLGRSFEYETEHRAIDSLLLARVSPMAIFFAKWFVNTILLAVAHVIAVIALGMLLSVSLVEHWLPFALVSLGVIASYSALSTLVAALTTGSRLRYALLPLILLPMVFPLFFCAVELTTQVLQPQAFAVSTWWAWLLGGLTVVYLTAGAVLFESAIRD